MLTFLSKKVVNDIPFRTDFGCCRDAMFSNDLAHNRMKQYIDLRVRLKHLKLSDEHLVAIGSRKERTKGGV